MTTDTAPALTDSRACFEWARRLGARWRLVAGAPRDGVAAELLRLAFGEPLAGPGGGPGECMRQHDRCVAVAAVLAGMPAGEIRRRARRRTAAYAEAAAWAFGVASREPRAFAAACEVWQRARLEWHDGLAAGLGGWSDPSAGPVYRRARRDALGALARGETWATVGRFQLRHARAEGFAAAAADRVDAARLYRDGAYRAGVRLGSTVVRVAGRRVALLEAATIR